MVFKAGYIIDEILDFFDNKQDAINAILRKCYFQVVGIDFISFPISEPEPIFSVIHNLISRGTPTRASKFLVKKYLSEIECSPNKREIIIDELVKIGQVQKVLCLLFANNILTQDKEVFTIYSNQLDINIVLLAVEDIQIWFNHIHTLLEKNNEFPSIKILSDPTLHYDLAISVNDIELKEINAQHKILILPAVEQSYLSKFITTSKIIYKNLGEVSKDGNTFIFNDLEKEKALEYVLQSVFKKETFRAGQIAIINRVLQGKDVIGLLPTGGGKSLTFQLAALLQPAMTIVIDPINSLMRDQYEKLIENYIDAALYINSYNTPKEREINEEKLQNAEILFCFVSPERLQIRKFRNHLKNCENKGTYFGYAVIDEAHCVSEWGHDFRQTYLRLGINLKNFCPVKEGKLTLFGLTATASYDVLADIQRELKMEDDAIQSLPAEQVDRKELVFNLVKVENTGIKEPTWLREKELGRQKYPKIKELLNALPDTFNDIVKKILENKEIGDEYKERLRKLPTFELPNFYGKNEKQIYPYAGIIFCPTKSDTLGNGVLALRDGYWDDFIEGFDTNEFVEGLNTLEFLEISTFFSNQDDNLAANELVDKEAMLSFENQGKFIQNEVNLMLATKAFGMGIDKPNIRYTLHYSLPSSVESFYQEAGRAGRDRLPALSSILYCVEDTETNLGFLENSFKGFEREKALLTELLEEVEYEDKFYLNYLTSILNEEFGMKFDLKVIGGDLIIATKPTKWIKVDGKPKPDSLTIIVFGYLHLHNLTYTLLGHDKAEKIIIDAKSFIQEFCPNTNYVNWLKQKQKAGLETLLNTGDTNNCLVIGFNNKKITEIKDLLLKENIIQKINTPVTMEGGNIWNRDDTERFIRAAYNFCGDSEEFVNDKYYEYERKTGKRSMVVKAKLVYEYERQVKSAKKKKHLSQDFPNSIYIPDELKPQLKEVFWKIRIAPDTLKAVYRLIILGVIDDYTIDYAGKAVVVNFSRKTEKQYKDNFASYLTRYVGEDTKNEWIEKANTRYKEESSLRKYLFTLAEFVDEIIFKKRENAIKYVKDLCEESINAEDVNAYFREDIILYFTSKFAKLGGDGSLKRDTDSGKIENFELLKTYINYIWAAPDGLGDQISNTKHLKAACARMKSATGFNNATIDLLSSFANFATEAQKEIGSSNFEESLLINEAKELYIKGFERFENKYKFSEWVNNMEYFNEKLRAISPSLLPIVENLQNQLICKNQKNWLSQFNQNFIDI